MAPLKPVRLQQYTPPTLLLNTSPVRSANWHFDNIQEVIDLMVAYITGLTAYTGLVGRGQLVVLQYQPTGVTIRGTPATRGQDSVTKIPELPDETSLSSSGRRLTSSCRVYQQATCRLMSYTPPCPAGTSHPSTSAAAHDDTDIFACYICNRLLKRPRPRIITADQTLDLARERHRESFNGLIVDFATRKRRSSYASGMSFMTSKAFVITSSTADTSPDIINTSQSRAPSAVLIPITTKNSMALNPSPFESLNRHQLPVSIEHLRNQGPVQSLLDRPRNGAVIATRTACAVGHDRPAC
ncbi:DNA (cytosine-5-)-methyltransferase [Fusarium mexicanum]|uniref:DNA (Cytosine-5-)-methyltransferase n=1 Tax=Fusarium mexicanum TaxID=751941 RepID=A0A8H5N809_9HYPO|nr:DNA (cytosine-5-)-methyltransferase [Fusarium mexicanum]